jgi:hypothetical protein
MKALLITLITLVLSATYILASNYYAKSYGAIYAESLCFKEGFEHKVCTEYLSKDYLINKLIKGAK